MNELYQRLSKMYIVREGHDELLSVHNPHWRFNHKYNMEEIMDFIRNITINMETAVGLNRTDLGKK